MWSHDSSWHMTVTLLSDVQLHLSTSFIKEYQQFKFKFHAMSEDW